MSEEHKYYTPSIEEFHVGFEYEYRWNNDKWTKDIYKLDSFLSVYNDGEYGWDNESGLQLRVKYLNAEDIESLGFNFNRTITLKDGDYSEYVKAIHTNAILSKSYDIFLLIKEINVIVNCIYSHNKFYGTIKNKSELKVLLKQLGIE